MSSYTITFLYKRERFGVFIHQCMYSAEKGQNHGNGTRNSIQSKQRKQELGGAVVSHDRGEPLRAHAANANLILRRSDQLQ